MDGLHGIPKCHRQLIRARLPRDGAPQLTSDASRPRGEFYRVVPIDEHREHLEFLRSLGFADAPPSRADTAFLRSINR